ncbi:MAG: hypothetical protein GY847_18005 [Proteobacteria bacterium]|nr:hypothetical protein [Pseudomonadota bacterium]
MKDNKCELLYQLGNNLITIGSGRPTTSSLTEWENFFVAEVMNEIQHLPYNTILLPWLKKVGVPTSAGEANDVLHVGNWEMGYLNADAKTHRDGMSVQADATIVLPDTVVLFEYKRPHSTPSENGVDIEQAGRHTLLAAKTCTDFNVRNWFQIFVCNTAPLLHVKNVGKIPPEEAVRRYFDEAKDIYLENTHVQKYHAAIESMGFGDENFTVVRWRALFEALFDVLDRAVESQSDEGLIRMYRNARVSLASFLERRDQLLK